MLWHSCDVTVICLFLFQAQYVFLYQALLEALQTGQTAIPAHEIDTRYPEMLQGDELRKQFEVV